MCVLEIKVQVQLPSIKMPLFSIQYPPILIRFYLWMLGSLSLLVCVFPFSTAEAAGNYLTHICPNTTIFTPNSVFQSNRNQLLSILVSNATNNSSFLKASTGGQNSTEIVYGLFICRGDVPTPLCKNCVDAAASKVIQLCPIEKQVLIWYDYCMVRYSNQSFFSTAEQSPGVFMPNATQVENGAAQFNQVLVSTMDGLIPEVINAAKKFATQEAKITGLKTTLYTLGQCTQDLSNGDCITCLTEAKAQLPVCCGGKAGGRVLYPSCNIRFELYPFYSVQESTTEAPPTPALKGTSKLSSIVIATILAPVLFSVLVVVVVARCFFPKSRLKRAKREKNKDHEVGQNVLLHDLVIPTGVTITDEGELVCSEELPFIDLATIKIATDDFSDSNKLGQGGFGSVYKGLLPDGREVAVKRLSRKSSQGLDEFKNEVILIAKLQHRNLVRLLACDFGGEEKLLLYEFMPNKSLDTFIYDSQRRAEFSWETYYSIIKGIARGLLYLHEDSRLRIIHRDLKPSNVLLDREMVAKISDFGMARIFCENQNTANTKRVVGTYGYMAPEYAMEGLFSVKSDVFSFGVIILEIISGKRNGGFFLTEHAKTLLAYAWRLWKDGKALEFVEPCLMESCPTTQILRCMHIGLLCVQEDPEERPTMSAVVVLLGSDSIELAEPKKPAIFAASRIAPIEECSPTPNGLTLSIILPR